MRWCASTSRTGAHAICSVVDKVAAELRATGPDDENVVWHPHAVTRADREARNAIAAWCCGLPGCPARANPPSLARWSRRCTGSASAPICWTAITCATACAAISASDEDRRENIRRVGRWPN